MKKIYFLALALTGFVFSNAQLTENFESYPTGPYFGGNWSNWLNDAGATELHIVVEADPTNSANKAGYIGSDGVQDPVLKLGDVVGGIWTTQLKVYVDFGAAGYFNFQDEENITAGNWGLQIHMNDQENWPDNPDQIVVVANDAAVAFSAPFTTDEWATLRIVQNLDTNMADVYYNGTLIYQNAADLELGQIGAMNFYSVSTLNSMYIDDIVFVQGDLGTSDVQDISTISVYPTVAKDVVNISAKSNISEVTVFNTNGQQVARVAGSGTSAQVNVSALPAGVYIVKTVAGKEIKTTKVVVK